MTDYVATRWYRSPELILTCDYALPVDIWAVGCIMGELIDGQPMFPGDDTLDQMYQIMKVMGPFDERLVRLFHENPAFKNVKFPEVSAIQTLDQRYKKKMDKVGLNLLSQLLSLDEKTRPTAEQALMHPFFSELLKDDVELIEELKRDNQTILQFGESRNSITNACGDKNQYGCSNNKVATTQAKLESNKRIVDKENIPNKNFNSVTVTHMAKPMNKRQSRSPSDNKRADQIELGIDARVNATQRDPKMREQNLTESFHEKQKDGAKVQVKNKSENIDYKSKANTKKFVTANSTNFVIKKLNNFGFSLYNPKEPTHAGLGKKGKNQPWSMAQSSMFRGSDVYGGGADKGLFPSIHNLRPNETRTNWTYKIA